MQWRGPVLLIAGLTMIYLVSLLQEVPFPHPVIVQATEPSHTLRNEATHIILNEKDDQMHRTKIWFDATLKGNLGKQLGVGSLRMNVNGYIVHSKKPKTGLLDATPEAQEWQGGFTHALRGPITKLAQSHHPDVLFSVLYHTIENEQVEYYARIYYFADSSVEFKDLRLPGSTEITSFSLENDSILYSRYPDIYRFRTIDLPKELTSAPHSQDAAPIQLPIGQPGEPVKTHHQPRGTESHAGIVSKLYSSNKDIYRVFSMDVHKTRRVYHINATLVDGQMSQGENGKMRVWKRREHMNSSHELYIDETLEYMAFVDGAHFQQERTEINMPTPIVSTSKDKKTIVVPVIKNSFLTMDYTDNVERLMKDKNESQYLYKDEDGKVIPEYFFWMQDDIVSSEASYDPSDISGIQLNDDGTSLAVWTESNTLYIYKRGAGDRKQFQWPDIEGLTNSSYKVPESQHHLTHKLEWILRMVVTPKEGRIGSTPIGTVFFWSNANINYITVGMKNGLINTYMLDVMAEQKQVNFWSFIKERWDLFFAMGLTVTLFVRHEYKFYP